MKIEVTVLESNLFDSGNWDNIDQALSFERYCRFLEDKISDEYPHAEVSITLQYRTGGYCPPARVYLEEHEKEQYSESDIQSDVSMISSDVYGEMNWLVYEEILQAAVLTEVKYIWDDRDSTAGGWIERRYYDSGEISEELIDGSIDSSVSDLTWGLKSEEITGQTLIKIYKSMSADIPNETYSGSEL